MGSRTKFRDYSSCPSEVKPSIYITRMWFRTKVNYASLCQRAILSPDTATVKENYQYSNTYNPWLPSCCEYVARVYSNMYLLYLGSQGSLVLAIRLTKSQESRVFVCRFMHLYLCSFVYACVYICVSIYVFIMFVFWERNSHANKTWYLNGYEWIQDMYFV